MSAQLVSIDPSENELKEKLICQFYFGGTSVCPKEFITRKLDIELIDKITLDPNMTWDTARMLVISYIANYVSWVLMTRVHYKQTEILVSCLILKILVNNSY